MRLNKLFVLLAFPLLSAGQNIGGPSTPCDTLIAKGEYPLAIECLEAVYEKRPQGPAFEQLLDVYFDTKDTAKAFKLVRKQSKKFGQNRPQYTAEYWVLSQTMGKRGPQWEEVLQLVSLNPYSCRTIARVLEKYGLLSQAVEIYEYAARRQPKVNVSFERAQLYAQLGQMDQQYAAYLQAIDENRGYYSNIKLRIAQNISDDSSGRNAEAAQKALYERIERGGNTGPFEPLLLFVWRETGKFDKAFRWLKAQAARDDFRAGAFRELANDAAKKDQQEFALDVYEYMIYQRPKTASGGWLNTVLQEYLAALAEVDQPKALQLCEDFNQSQCGDCFQWELARENFLQRQRSANAENTAYFAEQMRALRSRYPEPIYEGMTYLSLAGVLQLQGLFDRALMEYARAETLLGDSKEGDNARLQRAMCAFYSGDLPWAKIQLEVLLKSTSKDIANDALENALLIAANSVEDTLMEGLQLLREPMLLEFMGQKEAALEAYERIQPVLMANEVYDDVLYKKGRLLLELAQYEDAYKAFEQLKVAAGEGMWQEEANFYSARALFLMEDPRAQRALEDYLTEQPTGFFFEQARLMYRTFAK